MKNTLKIILILIILNIKIYVYANSGELNINEDRKTLISTMNINNEFKKDGIELNSAIDNSNNKNLVDKAIDVKNREVEKLTSKTEEEKNIESLNSALSEVEIKKELNQNQLNDIKKSLEILQKNIEENNKSLRNLKEGKKVQEINKELKKIENLNIELKKDINFKEKLIKKLETDLEGYELIEAKYKNLLSNYVEIKKEKTSDISKERERKLIILSLFLIGFFTLYIGKLLIIKNIKFKKINPNFGEYFDLIYGITLTIFLIIYLFYLFPELYALFILISGSLVFINAQIIASFVASLILFRNFKIGDIIKIGNEKGKIIKITPLNTFVRRINEYGVIEDEEVSIPNIDMLKEKVSLDKNLLNKQNTFSIILSLKGKTDIFEIVDVIKKNILFKMLNEKLHSLNPDSLDIFKSKYEHIDQDKVKITFFWIGNVELNRKIERCILTKIKEFIINDTKKEKVNKINICKREELINDGNQKASIIQDEDNSAK